MSNKIRISNDPVLDKIVRGYMPMDEQYIAGKLFPKIKVGSRKGDIKSAGTEFLRVNSVTKVGRTGTPEITVSMSKSSGWSCENEGLKILTLKEDGESYNQADWRAGMTAAKLSFAKMIKTAKMLAKEKEAADVLTSTSIITNNVTLSGSDQWSDYAGSNPLTQFSAAADSIYAATGREANTAYMGRNVFKKLRFHPVLFDKLGTTSSSERSKGLTKEQLALILEVDQILIGTVRYESAKEGQTSSMSSVWGNDFGMLFVNPNPTPELFEKSFGYEFVLDELVTDTFAVKDPMFAEYVRLNEDRDQLVLDATAAYLVKAAVA